MTFHKEMKIGLPNYSNITVGLGMTVEASENEIIDTKVCWDKINQELAIQTSGIDPSWITNNEYKNFYKTIIKTKKGGDKSE